MSRETVHTICKTPPGDEWFGLLARENYDFAQKERFIPREDRTFLTCPSRPHARGN